MSQAPAPISVSSAEAALARLGAAGAIGAPFQQAGFIALWLRSFGGLKRLRLVELAVEGGTWLLPLELAPFAGGRVARKIGGAHASVFTPLRLGNPRALTPADFAAMACALETDALALTDCPTLWAGAAPFAPGQPAAPDIARALTLEPDVAAKLYTGEAGKKLRAKARKLEALGALEAGFLTGDAGDSALEAMLGWKARRLAERGIPDPFAPPAMQALLRQGVSEGGPLRLFALTLAGRPIAALVLALGESHASGMTIAHDATPEIERCGPGDVLVQRLVAALAAQGLKGFDLGVGEARYKRLHCPDTMALVDVFAAASVRGRLLIGMMQASRALRRGIKRHAPLLEAMQGLRARLFGR